MIIRKKAQMGIFFALVFLFFSAISCLPSTIGLHEKSTDIEPYYITGSKENKKHFRELFNL